MDWMLFWTAFGAIGGTLGAVATAAAVIVALWQTKYANKKQLKVEFSDNIRIGPRRDNPAKWSEFVGITVTNIGNRNVKLAKWQLRLPDGRGALIVPEISVYGKEVSPAWPFTLEPEEQTSQYWDKDLFYAYMKDEVPKFTSKERTNKLVWVVTDSTGRRYEVKTSKTLQDYLDEANLATK